MFTPSFSLSLCKGYVLSGNITLTNNHHYYDKNIFTLRLLHYEIHYTITAASLWNSLHNFIKLSLSLRIMINNCKDVFHVNIDFHQNILNMYTLDSLKLI